MGAYHACPTPALTGLQFVTVMGILVIIAGSLCHPHALVPFWLLSARTSSPALPHCPIHRCVGLGVSGAHQGVSISSRWPKPALVAVISPRLCSHDSGSSRVAPEAPVRCRGGDGRCWRHLVTAATHGDQRGRRGRQQTNLWLKLKSAHVSGSNQSHMTSCE
jgi:hypothetical protein